MSKHIAVYTRVSSRVQDTASQEPDLKRWAVGQDAEVKWYRDQFTGKTMDWPGFQKLMNAVREETVYMVVVWRLDAAARLGRG